MSERTQNDGPGSPQDPPVRLRIATLGDYQTNCYVVEASGHDRCWIIDTGYEPAALIDQVLQTGKAPEAIIYTHAHSDHIAGGHEVLAAFPGIPVMIHADEERWLNEPELNLSARLGRPVTGPAASRTLAHGDTLTLGKTTWTVLHTPGHSPGSISLACAHAPLVIAGDALFAGSVGRTDFPGSSADTLAESIRTHLYTLPDETHVFPGHGPSTTIGQEKQSNPFVRG